MKKTGKSKFKMVVITCVSLMFVTVVFAESFTVPGRPGRPNVVDIERDYCDIEFDAPDSDGGSRITGYLVEKRNVYDGRWVKVEIVRKCRCRIDNLIEGSVMEFRAIASNKAGFGDPSYPSNPVIIRGPQTPR